MQTVQKLPSSLEGLKKPVEQLYYRGDLSLLEMPLISIVGTRKPNSYTKDMTYTLSKKLSQAGYVIVSGAAMGVDAIAHQGAFPRTIAVMANSLDIYYPAVNRSLIEKLSKSSLILSEYSPTTKATRYSFVHRNRIVVALGQILIITQADLESGSLRSFEYAKVMGKEVYVLSHRIGESRGTQMLVESGEAKLITDLNRFLEEIGAVQEKSEIAEEDFLSTPKPLKEALKHFGPKLYEMELEGIVEIKDLKVRRL